VTPAEVIEYARQQYASLNDDYFTDSELYRHIYAAEMQLAMQTNCIRNVYTASTVASQQEYTRPTLAISIKRITYEGSRLYPIDMREDDSLTLSNQSTTASGTPQYYYEFGTSFFLRPIPSAVGTLKIFAFCQPDTVSVTSTLDVPGRYHPALADYLCSMKAAKDKNYQASTFHMQKWLGALNEAKKYERKMLRGDAFGHVKDEMELPMTILGAT
jgi:hypothetical protein